MSANYKHKQYFRVRGDDSSLKTFSSIDNAKELIGFSTAWNTSSPTKTEALADSDQTLVITYEFDSKDDQDAFLSAISVFDTTKVWPATSGSAFIPYYAADKIENFKTEWLDTDGTSVGSTTTQGL